MALLTMGLLYHSSTYYGSALPWLYYTYYGSTSLWLYFTMALLYLLWLYFTMALPLYLLWAHLRLQLLLGERRARRLRRVRRLHLTLYERRPG